MTKAVRFLHEEAEHFYRASRGVEVIASPPSVKSAEGWGALSLGVVKGGPTGLKLFLLRALTDASYLPLAVLEANRYLEMGNTVGCHAIFADLVVLDVAFDLFAAVGLRSMSPEQQLVMYFRKAVKVSLLVCRDFAPARTR